MGGRLLALGIGGSLPDARIGLVQRGAADFGLELGVAHFRAAVTESAAFWPQPLDLFG